MSGSDSMDALSRRDAVSVSEQGRRAGSRRPPPDSIPEHWGVVIRKVRRGERIALVLDGRRLGWIEMRGPTSDGARIVLALDRQVIIERESHERET